MTHESMGPPTTTSASSIAPTHACPRLPPSQEVLSQPTLEPSEALLDAAEALLAEGGQLGLQFPELVRVRCWLEAVKWNAHVSAHEPGPSEGVAGAGSGVGTVQGRTRVWQGTIPC
jgi:hypothetical protein